MAVQLNHTIVPVRDKQASADFLAEILGLDAPKPFGPFLCVETANGVSLDYDDRSAPEQHHYAFLVTEEEFDAIFTRVTERGLTYWADRATARRTVSTTTGAASISRTRPVTTWRSSPGPMAVDHVGCSAGRRVTPRSTRGAPRLVPEDGLRDRN